MAEIARLPYYEAGDDTFNPGPESGETDRTLYTCMDDYHGWSQTAGNLTDYAGNAYPDSYAGYARSVAVTQVSNYGTVFTRTYNGQRVVVTVTNDTGRSWTLERVFAEPQD